MKKCTIILFLIALFYNIPSFGQTVTTSITLVNNANVNSTGPINLGTNTTSNISLSTNVSLPSAPNDLYPGTITVYYQKNTASPAIIPQGGNGGNLLFLGGTSVSRNFSITLDAAQFDLTGGILYTEYKSYSGVKYKSGNVSIIKSSTSGGGIPADAPNPANIANTLCCNQTVRVGDKPAPIIGSQYANPYENFSYGINSSWSISSQLQCDIDAINKTLNFDYTTELKNIAITRSLGYNSSTNLTNKSNTVTITVVPSPILSNTISTNMPVNADGYTEFSNLKGIDINTSASKVNLNILQDPFHINQRGDNYADIDGFQWEYTIIDKNNPIYGKKNWVTISNKITSTLQSFNPLPSSSTDDSYYLVRGIASYKGIKRVSNELKIMSRTIRNNNTICCDQYLKLATPTELENPETIIGSIPVYVNNNIIGTNLTTYSVSYQWQSQPINRSTGVWADIVGATSKDYLPLPLKITSILAPRSGGIIVENSYNYRRIAKLNYQILVNGLWSYGTDTSYSNESHLGVGNYTPNETIFPNPVSSILNIASTYGTLNNKTKISILNSMGLVVNSNNYSLISPNLINIDVSNLLNGTYFIIIQTESGNNSLIFVKN